MRIDDNQRTNVCKIGQGKDCCRYLTVGGNGFECEKLSPLKFILDLRVKMSNMVAQGDNCNGLNNKEDVNKDS